MGEIVGVDSKGRIAIPVSIRNKLGIRDGAQLVLEVRGDEIIISGTTSIKNSADHENDDPKDFLSH